MPPRAVAAVISPLDMTACMKIELTPYVTATKVAILIQTSLGFIEACPRAGGVGDGSRSSRRAPPWPCG